MTSSQRRGRQVLWALAAGAVLVAIAIVSYRLLLGQPPGGTSGTSSTAAAPAASSIVTRFTLVDHTGRAVTEKAYQGRWKLVFFGFTHCPDVCPTALNTVSEVLSSLGSTGDGIVPLFVSVDPTRDRPETLARYVAAFDKRIVGLTGTEAQVSDAARAFRVYYARVAQKTASGGYTMNHSAILYLMGPDGQFVTHFGHNEKPADVAASIKKEIGK